VFAWPGQESPTQDPGRLLALDRVRGSWRLAHHGSDWRLRVESLELGRDEPSASLTVDMASSGQWVRATLDKAPLGTVIAVAQWLAPPLQLAGVEMHGTSRNVTFDWSSLRAEGDKLRAYARFEDAS